MNRNSSFINIRNVSKSFKLPKKGIKEALSQISLEIFQGEVLGLLGVNGAGKTTLSSILATLHPPSSGDIFWMGKSIYKELLTYRKTIGYCPQHPNIEKSLTISENLIHTGLCYGLPKEQVQEEHDALLENFNLKEYASSTPQRLSGGYRQRFLIARSLIHRPKLIILDEPTVGLDPHIRRQLWDVIASLRKKGISVLLTTHYLDEAEALSDRVCLIHGGKIRIVDTPSNLKHYHQKNNLEEVFLKFVDDPNSELFNSVSASHE